jgi:hypothetical protein
MHVESGSIRFLRWRIRPATPVARRLEFTSKRSNARHMNATKILWGQILLVSFVVLAFIWAATEWTAWCLGFQPQLGQPWFELFGWPVYRPQDFFWWWFSFDAYAPHIFGEGGAGTGPLC